MPISKDAHHKTSVCLQLLCSAIALLCLLGQWSTVAAQSYDLRRFREESGLAEGYIYTVVQDPKGFLFLGTGAGLYRFDGAKFKVFDKGSGLAESFTTASFCDSEGRVWLGHFEGNISLLNELRLRPLQDSNIVKSVIYGFAEDHRGQIWGASQQNLFLVDTTGVQKTFDKGLDGQRVFSFAIGRESGTEYFLVGTDEGLLVYEIKGKGLSLLYASTKVPATKLQSIVHVPARKSFLIGTEDEGLIEFTPHRSDSASTVVAYNASTGFPAFRNIQCMLLDNAKDLWIGTPDMGFWKLRANVDKSISLVTPTLAADSIGHENLKSIYQDRFGQVWLGTYGNGLICLSERLFTTYRLRNDSTVRLEVLCSMEDRTGDLWIGTNKGLYVVDREEVLHSGGKYSFAGNIGFTAVRRYGLADGLPAEQITSIMQDASQNIFVGTRTNGVAMLPTAETRFLPISVSDMSLSNNINGITQGKDGTIWIATTDGAFSYSPSTGKTNFYGTQNKLPHNNIYGIFCDTKGRLWFATHTNRLAMFDGKTFENLEVSEHGEIPNITCIAQSKDGSLWLGSDGAGLYRYDGKTFTQYTKLDGLQSNYVYHIVIDHYDNVWTTHRDGFSRLISDTGHILAYPTKAFFPREENPVSGAMIDAYGNIWFSTEHGLVRYNWFPTRNKTAAPFTSIQTVQIGDSIWDPAAPIDLPYDTYSIRFEFLGLTFLNQADVLYQCKLEGREQDWSAPTKQNFMTYQALEDGDYTFHVRACNVFGRCNEASAKISFRIAPPFWKTWWFQLLMLLLVAALVYSYIRYRFYRLNREKAILEEKVRRRTVELQAEKEKVERANIELERLSLVASETDNAVFILDAAGNLTWVNAGFTRLTGFSMEEMFAMRNGGKDFLDTSSDPRVKERLEHAVRENISVQYESELPSRSGQKIWVISTLTPILDKEGRLRNIVIIDSNITDRKLAEEKIRQMNAELESLVAARTRELAEANASLQVENAEHIKTAERLKVINSELDTFVYRASHDLKGPLASLMGLINIAGMELSENQVAARYLGLMDKASKRLDGILIDLIEATQVKQRQVERVDLNALTLAEAVADTLKQRTDMTNADVVLEIDPKLQLHSDETLLNSILQNFLGNALKYRDATKEKAIAKLAITENGAYYTIAVTDNGIGISPDMQGKVFDMFFRGSHTMGGSGLGLYIVKQAVEKLGGTVHLTSQLGEGTTMTAVLPK